MKLRFYIILLIIVCVPLPAYSAQMYFEKEVQNIPANVTDVYRCGHWSYSGNTGFYRVIYVEFLNGCSLLFVQWMLDYQITGGQTKVMHTLSIDEFNSNDHIELTFDKPQCESIKEGIKLKINATSGHDNKERKIEITVFNKFGKYSFYEQISK